MKKLSILLTMMMLTGAVFGQNKWNIVLHKKVLLSGKEVNEEKNVKLIRSSDWQKSGYLEVVFKEEQPSGMKHTLQFSDETGNPLIEKDSVLSAKISTAVLRKAFAGKKEMKIYMILSPSNPRILAPSRIYHLATLKLP